MKKSFYIGFSVAFLLLILGYFTKNTGFFGSIALGIGIIFLVIGGIAGGVFVDGNQMRANYYTESKDDRKNRQKTFLISGIIGFPHLIVGGLLLLV